jgi:hypothetical protein
MWCRSQLPLDARDDPSFITTPTQIGSDVESDGEDSGDSDYRDQS